MTRDVEIGGRTRAIELQQRGNAWAVTVDGRRQLVDVARAGDRWSFLVRPSWEETEREVAPRSYEVAISSLGHDELLITVNGRPFPVALGGAGRARGRHRRGAPASTGARRIVAPMPGRIVKLLVQAGESVSAQQGLVIVEAMKMENELRAPVAGIVRAVRVAQGEAVEANTVLIEME